MASQDEIILLAGGNDDNSWKGTGHLLENYEEGYTISSSSNGPQNNNSNVLNSNLSFLNGTWMNNSSSQKDEFLIFRFPTPVTITSYKMWETKDQHLSYPPIKWELHSLTMFGNMDQFIDNDNLDPNFWYNKINDSTFIKEVDADRIGYDNDNDEITRKYTNAKSIIDDEQFHEYKIDSSKRKKGNILIMYFPYPFSRINKHLSKENPAVTIGGLAFYGIKHPHDKNGFIDIIHNFDVIGIHEKKYRVMPLKISDISNTYDDFFNILSQQPWYNDIELTKAVSNTVGFIKEDDNDIMNYDYFFDIYFGPLFCYDIDSKSLKYKKIYSNEDSNVILGPPAMTDFPRSPSLFQKILSLKESLLTNDGEGFTAGRKGFYQRRQVPGYIADTKSGGGWGVPTTPSGHPAEYTIPENWNDVGFGSGTHDGNQLSVNSRNYLADNNGYANHLWYDYQFSSQDKGPLIEKVMTGPYDELLEVTEGTYIYGHALNFGGNKGNRRTLVNPYTFANYDIFNVWDDGGGGSNISVWNKAIEHFGNGNYFSNMRESNFSGGLGGIYKAGESQGGGGGGVDEDGYIMWKLDASYSHITVEFATNTFPRTRDQVMSHGWWVAGHNDASNNPKAGWFDLTKVQSKAVTLGEPTNKLQGFTALYAQSESSVKLHENWEVGFRSDTGVRDELTSTSANGLRTKNNLTSRSGVPCRLSIKDPSNGETITINASEFHAKDERSDDSTNSQLPILEPPGKQTYNVPDNKGGEAGLRELNWGKLLNETSNNSLDVKDWVTDCSRNYWDNLPALYPVPASWRGPPYQPNKFSEDFVNQRMSNYPNGGPHKSPWSELYMWYKTLAPDLYGAIGGMEFPGIVRYSYNPRKKGNTNAATSPLDPFGVNTSKFRELVKIDEINTKKIYSSSYRDMSLNAGNWMMLLERISIIFGVEITYSTGDPESISDGFSSWQQSDTNTNNPKYLDLSDNEIIMVSYEDHIEDLTSETTVKVIEDKYYLFNYDNIDTSFNYLRKYGLKNDTTYILKNIQDDYAIRIIDDNNTNFITYEGDQSKKITHNGNDYYYGDVSVNVVGNFGQVSIESINNGYINGEYLFQYNDDDWDVKHNYVPQHIPSTSEIFNSSSITSTDLQGNDNNYYTSIDIPNTITSIGSNVFKNNHFSDISFEITSQLTFIGPKAFFTEIVPISEVAKPLTLIIPDSVTDISDSAFENCKIDNLIIGNNVTSIGKRAFKNNDISSLTIPNSVTYIGEEAFTNNNITSLIIPNNVTTIKLNAFTGNKITFLQVPTDLYPNGFSNGYNHNRNNPNTPPLYGALPWFKRSNLGINSFSQALPPILPWWDVSYTQDPLDNRDRRILDDRDSDGDYDAYEHLWLADYKVRRKQLGSTHPISDLSFVLSYNPNDPAPDISDQLIVYT